MEAISALDKAAEQGVIHRNNAARRKSRLVKAFNKLEPVKVEAAPVAEEPVVEAEPKKKPARRILSPKGRAAATSSPKGKKVEEPMAEAAAEPKAEPKKKTAVKKPVATSSPKGKKPAATSSPKGKKTETTSSPKGKKTTTRKKPTATK
jgi:hypothetical protein